MNVGTCATTVLLPYVPRGVRVLVVPLDVAVEIESLVRRVNDAVRKVDAFFVDLIDMGNFCHCINSRFPVINKPVW